MPRTAEGKKLARNYRVQSLAVRARSMREVMDLFPLLDLEDLDKTQARWLRANMSAIERGRLSSATLAARFSRRFAALETGQALGPALTPITAQDRRKLARSLLYVPTRVKMGMTRGETVQQAGNVARSLSVSKAATAVSAAETDTLASIVQGTNPTMSAQQFPRGWQRVAGADACDFCTMLASRGAVYLSSTVDFHMAKHQTCACTVECIYQQGPLTRETAAAMEATRARALAETFRPKSSSSSSGLRTAAESNARMDAQMARSR